MSATWQSIAARKQNERASKIHKAWQLPTSMNRDRDNVLGVPRECGILTPQELRITEDFDATALVSGLTTGLLSSIDVVTAFCKRAAIAHQVTNCLTEILFDDALARARELDAYRSRTGKPIGPLHGLPVSLKDTFNIRGYDSSVGIAAFCFQPAQQNAALVDVLLDLGAVLFCKTNVPQTMMTLDSWNNVFGRTINPRRRGLTAGGSTGGEGALIAMRGSVLGIGTDIGGSIRVPALCNGLFGVKPSHGRVPYAGQQGGALPGSSKIGIEATAGPIATSVRDCEMLLRAVCDAEASLRDPDCVAQSWRQQAALERRGGKLLVGIMRTDGHVTPLPPVQRVMEEVARTLAAVPSQVEVVELDIGTFGAQCLKIFNGVMSTDGGNTWFGHLEKTNEPLHPWLQGRLKRRPAKSLDEVRDIQASRTDLQTKFLEVWRENGGYWSTSSGRQSGQTHRTLDLILCPGAPHPPAPIDSWNTTNYTSMFNLLDLPSAMMPVRTVNQTDIETELQESTPLNGWDKINQELWTKTDRTLYLDSALSVQVVAPRLMERKLIEGMAVLDELLQPLRGEARTSKL